MKIAVDTNILLRTSSSMHSGSIAASSAVDRLTAQGHALCVFPQVLYEYWVVATRPIGNANGFGRSCAEARAELEAAEASFLFLPDIPAIYNEWKSLVSGAGVSGKLAHDARIVAAMRAHGVSHILTFNGEDFRRFANLTVIDPAAVVEGPSEP